MPESLRDYLTFKHSVDAIKKYDFFPFLLSEDKVVKSKFDERKAKFAAFLTGTGGQINSHDVNEYLKEYNFMSVVELDGGKGLKKFDVLMILFYGYNFYVIYSLPYDTTYAITKLFQKLEREFMEIFREDMQKLAKKEKSYSDYAKHRNRVKYACMLSFSIYLKLKPVVVKYLEPKLKDIPSFRRGGTSGQSRVNKTVESLGYFYPVAKILEGNDVINLCKPVCLSARDCKEYLEERSVLKFEAISNHEATIVDHWKYEISDNLTNFLKQFNINGIREQSTYNMSLGTKVRPDITLISSNDEFECRIPIEMKAGRPLAKLVEIMRDPSQESKRSIPIMIFTQIIYQCLFVKSKVGFLVDETTSIMLNIISTASDFNPDTPLSDKRANTDVSGGAVITQLKCECIILPIESQYSMNAIILGLINNHLVNFNNSIKEEMFNLQNQLQFCLTKSIHDTMNHHCAYLNKVVKFLFNAIEEVDNDEITPKDTESSRDSDFKFTNTSKLIFTQFEVEFRTSQLSLLNKILQLPSYRANSSVAKLKKRYEFISILSGAQRNQNFALVIKLKSKVDQKHYVLKIYDPVWSVTWTYHKLDALKSLKKNLKYISKEISSLYVLRKTNMFASIVETGFLPYTISDKHKSDIKTLEELQIGGLYFIATFIEGKTLQEISPTRRLQCRTEAMNVLRTCNQLGVYHCDIRRENIVVGEDNKVTLIDFGSASLADIRNDSFGKDASFALKDRRDQLMLSKCFKEYDEDEEDEISSDADNLSDASSDEDEEDLINMLLEEDGDYNEMEIASSSSADEDVLM